MRAKTSQRQVAAFFDLDLTITSRDSFRYYLNKQYLSNLRNWHFVPHIILWGILRKLRVISLQVFKEKALVSLVGKNETVMKDTAKSFFEKHLVNIIRTRALKKIGWHKERGHFTFIVSSCPDIYILPLTEHLGCDGYECSRLAYRDTKFVGKIDGRDCLGPEKVERLQAILENKDLDLAHSYAYSDHESDLPLLEYVGNPIAVTPTEELRRIASQRGWKIEEW